MTYLTGKSLFDDWMSEIKSVQPPPTWSAGDPVFEHIEGGPGRIILVAGPPASGKTALFGQWTMGMLTSNPALRILIANVEMPPHALLTRQLSRLSGVDTDREFSANFDRQRRATQPVVDPRVSFRSAFLKPFRPLFSSTEKPCGHGSRSRFDRVEQPSCRIAHIHPCWPTWARLGLLPLGRWLALACARRCRRTEARKIMVAPQDTAGRWSRIAKHTQYALNKRFPSNRVIRRPVRIKGNVRTVTPSIHQPSEVITAGGRCSGRTSELTPSVQGKLNRFESMTFPMATSARPRMLEASHVTISGSPVPPETMV